MRRWPRRREKRQKEKRQREQKKEKGEEEQAWHSSPKSGPKREQAAAAR